MKCPCHSQKEYEECCKSYHEGELPLHAEQLMRSRYSGYALRKIDYIIATTHPEHPNYSKDKKQWRKEIESFSKETEFRGLEILEATEGENEAYVTFRAILFRKGQDATFTEKSYFLKVDGRWLYHSGQILS